MKHVGSCGCGGLLLNSRVIANCTKCSGQDHKGESVLTHHTRCIAKLTIRRWHAHVRHPPDKDSNNPNQPPESNNAPAAQRVERLHSVFHGMARLNQIFVPEHVCHNHSRPAAAAAASIAIAVAAGCLTVLLLVGGVAAIQVLLLLLALAVAIDIGRMG